MKITIATRRRIERLELTLAVGRPVGLWPQILSCSDWEAVALPMQYALSTDSKNDHVDACGTNQCC